jgi:hypothetical protein
LQAPCALPNAWPPPMRATVSLSVMPCAAQRAGEAGGTRSTTHTQPVARAAWTNCWPQKQPRRAASATHHRGESATDVKDRVNWHRLAVDALRVDVDQAKCVLSEGRLALAVACSAGRDCKASQGAQRACRRDGVSSVAHGGGGNTQGGPGGYQHVCAASPACTVKPLTHLLLRCWTQGQAGGAVNVVNTAQAHAHGRAALGWHTQQRQGWSAQRLRHCPAQHTQPSTLVQACGG